MIEFAQKLTSTTSGPLSSLTSLAELDLSNNALVNPIVIFKAIINSTCVIIIITNEIIIIIINMISIIIIINVIMIMTR